MIPFIRGVLMPVGRTKVGIKRAIAKRFSTKKKTSSSRLKPSKSGGSPSSLMTRLSRHYKARVAKARKNPLSSFSALEGALVVGGIGVCAYALWRKRQRDQEALEVELSGHELPERVESVPVVVRYASLVTVPLAIGLSYTANKSIPWALVHGLISPIYLAYRGVQFVAKKA